MHFRETYLQCVQTTVRWLTPERLRVYPVVIFILTMFTWAASLYLGHGLIDSSGNIIGADFLAFYNAGQFYWQGRLTELYSFKSQYMFQKSLVAPMPYDKFSPFVNPPFVSPFFGLFTLTPFLTSLLLWWLFGLILILFSVYLLRSELSALKTYSLVRLYCYCFLFYPTLNWLMYGQNSPISLLLLTFFFVKLRQEKDLPAGVGLGLLFFKPQLALLPVFLLIIKGRGQALIGTFLGAAFWVALGFLISPAAMFDYVKLVPHLGNLLRLNADASFLSQLGITAGNSLFYQTWGISSLFGFSVLLLDNIWRTGADLLFALLSLAMVVAVFLYWRPLKWEPASRNWDMNMAATIVFSLLFSPHLFLYDLLILLLPLGIVLSHYVGGTGNRPLDGNSLLFWTAILYIACYVGPYLAYAQLKFWPLLGMPQFAVQFTTLVLAGWAFAVMQRST